MQGENPQKQNLERMKLLSTIASEGKLDPRLAKGFLKEEMSRMKEISEFAYKEGITRLLEMARQKGNTSILAKDPLVPSTNISNNTSLLSTARVRRKKLPKISRDESPSEKSSKKTPGSPPTNPSPPHLPRNSPHLQPLFTVSNCIARAAFKSRVGSVRGKPKLHNQDGLIVKQNLQNIRGQYLFGVCDGHGAQGQAISDYFKEQFVQTVELLLPFEPKPDQIQKALIGATEKVANSLAGTQIDIVFSGCTCLNVVVSGNNLVCANLGNCRAVIGRGAEKWQSLALNVEHTLQNRKERERMIANNARIAVDTGENGEADGVERIYMGNQDVPGLEITRSIGDKIGKFIGMISVPETKAFVLQADDKFVIIGTQGLWKYMTGIEAVCIVRYSWESNEIEQSCKDLVDEAERRWKSSGNDKEDITVVVVYLNVPN